MAEQVKRRVDGARLAVASAAAAIIAGGAAAASTGAPSKDVAPNGSVTSKSIKDHSLLVKDFKPGEIYSKVKADGLFLKKGLAQSTYLKKDSAGSTYLKTKKATQLYVKKDTAASQFVQGDGSVFTGVGDLTSIAEGEEATIMQVSGFVRVIIRNNDGPDTLAIENLTGGSLLYTAENVPSGQIGGTIANGETRGFDYGSLPDGVETIQLHSPSQGRVATLTISVVGGDDVFAQMLVNNL